MAKKTNDTLRNELKEMCKEYNKSKAGVNNVWIPNQRARPKHSTNVCVTK